MAPIGERRRVKTVFGLSALDDPKWKRIDDKFKALLKRKTTKSKGDGSSATASGAKWLLRGPQGACLAAIIPGDTVVEAVMTTGILSFINLYNFVLVVRVLLTWFPQAPGAIVGPVSTLADPYLNLFRGIIPPIGGTIDLSPVLAFVAINIFTNAAEALPCDLETHEARAAGRTGRGRGLAWRKRTIGTARQKLEDIERMSFDKLSELSRMNPVLLLEGYKQRKQQAKQGIA